MSKVKVSAIFFEALKQFEKDYKEESLEEKIRRVVRVSDKKAFHSFRSCLNEVDSSFIIKCLINGYEIEKTKEEILLESYKKVLNNMYSQESDHGFAQGIKHTLQVLGIEIKGINA